MRSLWAAVLGFCLLVGSCKPTSTPLESVVAHTSTAIVRLHGPGRSCTAFHVGQNLFLTAAHCINAQTLLFLDAEDGKEYQGVPVLVDEKLDLAAVQTNTDFIGGVLELSGPQDGVLLRGASLVAMGYPGYYGLQLTLEVGVLKDFVTRDGERLLISSNLGYFGESGGPIIAVASGKVVGLNDAMSEEITDLGDSRHVHNTTNILIAAPELEAFLERVRTKIWLEAK